MLFFHIGFHIITVTFWLWRSNVNYYMNLTKRKVSVVARFTSQNAYHAYVPFRAVLRTASFFWALRFYISRPAFSMSVINRDRVALNWFFRM